MRVIGNSWLVYQVTKAPIPDRFSGQKIIEADEEIDWIRIGGENGEGKKKYQKDSSQDEDCQ